MSVVKDGICFPNHHEVCKMARESVSAAGGNTASIGMGARYPEYDYALRHGLITQEQYDAAKRYYGRLWNYAGD